jgi:hypothetical protein
VALNSEIKFLAHNITYDNYFPSWHIDKFAFQKLEKPEQQTIEKVFIIAFKGQSTLYQVCNSECRANFLQLANQTAHAYGYSKPFNYYENYGIDALFSLNQSYSADCGHGSVHNSGVSFGAIHASPFGRARFIMITTLKLK